MAVLGDLRYLIGFYQRNVAPDSPPDYGKQPGYPPTATFTAWNTTPPASVSW